MKFKETSIFDIYKNMDNKYGICILYKLFYC